MLRHLLYEAASALMTRCRQPSKLRAWGVAIARRRGAKRARVAVARKLAVIMHRMWVSGSRVRNRGGEGEVSRRIASASFSSPARPQPGRRERPVRHAPCERSRKDHAQ